VDRCVLLVDAGYLFAQGGLAIHGTKARHKLALDAQALITGLKDLVEERSGMPLLRTYWYDGAQQGIPTAEHQRVAHVPFVKLRMGRINAANQQKGVDALIYRDLMTLATERAVTEAYLLSGDDDLREGVIFAQDRGMRVSLLGIKHNDLTSQSKELLFEVDDRINVDLDLLRRALAHLPTQPTLSLGETTASQTPNAVGEEYARTWLENATDETKAALIQGLPTIPRTLDIDLVRTAEATLGRSLRGEDATKRTIRQGFWTVVQNS
jgi:uncharacterized LabA/DUF88 family protein